MSTLNKEDLKEIDKKIDSVIASQKLLTFPKDIAILNLLRHFEEYNIDANSEEAWKKGQDALHYAIQWIYKCCPCNTKPAKFNQTEVYSHTQSLHATALQYSEIWDIMTLLWKERAIGERKPDGTIYFRYANQFITDMEIADQFIGSPDSPEQNDNFSLPIGNEMRKEFSENISVQPNGSGKIKYFVADNTFKRIAQNQQKLIAHLWELGESWDLGGYTVAQFREFWVALVTLCWIHHQAYSSPIMNNGAFESLVKILKRKRWETKLSHRSGLDKKIISLIMDDLIYDPTLYTKDQKQPDVTYQPFFPIDSDILALSNWLVLLSNAERNIWDLVSIKRGRLHSTLRNQKEKLQIEKLTPLFKSFGLEIFDPIKFKYNGQESNLDLLVLDRKDSFGIGFQLKWLNTPDRIRDVFYIEKELEIGQGQAFLSLQWLESKPDRLKQLTGLSEKELEKFEFKTMVLSKNTIGSGWNPTSTIPIINERLVMWILGEPHKRNLRTLWRVGEERRYLPQRGKHFKDEDVTIGFGGVRFFGEKLGMTLLDPWEPLNDINLADLKDV